MFLWVFLPQETSITNAVVARILTILEEVANKVIALLVVQLK